MPTPSLNAPTWLKVACACGHGVVATASTIGMLRPDVLSIPRARAMTWVLLATDVTELLAAVGCGWITYYPIWRAVKDVVVHHGLGITAIAPATLLSDRTTQELLDASVAAWTAIRWNEVGTIAQTLMPAGGGAATAVEVGRRLFCLVWFGGVSPVVLIRMGLVAWRRTREAWRKGKAPPLVLLWVVCWCLALLSLYPGWAIAHARWLLKWWRQRWRSPV